jgi:hypothetical protein
MAIALASKPGLTGATALSIPKDWDPTWFRNFISNMLKGADVRNAVGVNGISVTGTIASPYATIGFSAPVTLPGPVTITSPITAVYALIVNGHNGQYAQAILGGSGAGQSFGLVVAAGTNSSDNALLIENSGGTTTFFAVNGAGSLYTYNGTKPAAASGVAQNLQALPNNGYSSYLVSAALASVNDATDYSAVSLVSTNGTAAKIIALQTAALLTITLSGATVQATQSSGGAQTISYSILRIA